MNKFMEMVQNDHKAIFLNPAELGEMHNLNGVECLCSVQSLTDREKLTQQDVDFGGLAGELINVFCVKYDLQEKPFKGQLFRLDRKVYYVREVVDNYDMLKITLGMNKP